MYTSNENINVQTKESQSWEHALENERNYIPSVNIYETADDFVIVANTPGISKENIKLKLEDSVLTIFGKMQIDSSSNKKFLLKETRSGNYYRKFKISDSIDDSKINANYENGQLVVKLPKQDRLKPRDIEIRESM